MAGRVAGAVEKLDDFRLLTRGDQLPVFAFTTASDVTRFDVFDVSRRLREAGWLVPAYTFPPNREDLSVLRWTDTADTMVVTFGEVSTGARTGPVKRQYWVRQGSRWKIFYEGVIG